MSYQVRKHHLTSFQWFTIDCFGDAVVAISFGKVGNELGHSNVADQAARELDEYFAGLRTHFDVKLAPHGTPFQMRVWQALQKIPYGVFPSYSDIAEAIGRPTATRAVGMANNRNPIPVMIPCHRVIGRNGDLVGFGGGLDMKRRLMDLELSYTSDDNERSPYRFTTPKYRNFGSHGRSKSLFD
jgi:methylated-DNA-[protein]-cysteine S-methyltransferase